MQLAISFLNEILCIINGEGFRSNIFQAIQTTSKGFLLKCYPGKYPVSIFKQCFNSMVNREIVITFAFY